MKFALTVCAFIIAALILPFFWSGAGQKAGVDPNSNLPWQIEMDGRGGASVFGLQIGVSTLADVRQRFGGDVEVAIIARPDEVGALEAYFGQVALGFVLARVIVTVDADSASITAMRERAVKADHMESATRKIRPHPDDLALAERLPIRAVSVIPTVNLDEETVVQRFGRPGERLMVSEKRIHLLYPEKGLDVVIDTDGKELLQYVAPRHFAMLREPLLVEQKEVLPGAR